VFGVDHEHDAAVALALARVEPLRIEHDTVSFGLHFCKPCEVVPGHLAVIGFGTAWPGAWRSLVERAEIGVEAQCADVLKPQGTDSSEALLLTVIAIGDDLA
jgi:hypothetical protein